MVLQNSGNQSFSNNADGWSLGGGVTARTLTLSGANLPILLSSVGSGNLLQFNGANWVNVPGTTFGTGSLTSVATGTGLTGGPITNTGTISVAANGITNNLFRQSAANTLVGNPTGATANVTDVSVGTGLTFNTGTIQVAASGATAGSYGNGSNYTTFTINALGQITAVGTVALGNMAFQNSSNVNITGGTITGISNPVNPTDVANKQYVDGVASGLDTKQAVAAATTGTLLATYAGSPAFTLTENTNGALVVDGYTPVTNDRILVKNQATEAQNGIYVVTATGSAGAPYVLTRSTDMNTSAEIPAAFTFVVGGNTQNGIGYVVTGFTEFDVLDSNNIVWTQYSQAGAYTAGSGLSINTANVPAVFTLDLANLSTAPNALGSNNLISISQLGTTYSTTLGSLSTFIAGASVFGTGAITVSAGTVSLVTTNKFTQTGGTLDLNIDGTTIVSNSGTLAVGVIGSSNIGSNAITTNSIANSTITYAKLQNESAHTILGNPGTAAAAPSEIAIGTGLVLGTNGTLSVALSGATAGTYAMATVVINSLGQVTSATATTVGSGLTFTSNLLSANVDGTTINDASGPLAVVINGTGGLQATPTGLALNISNLTTDPNALGTNDLTTVSDGGTTYTTTLGSLASFFSTNSVFGTGAIHVTNGTVSLTTTANFTQTAGTLDLSNTGVTPGTYGVVVVDAKGRVTAGTGGSVMWVDVTTTTQTLAAGTGYMTDNASMITLTLPATANFGDIIPIVGYGSGGWTIAQNAGQIIHFGNQNTTSGTTGYLASNNRFDSLELFCAKASAEFVVRNSVGDITVN